eukprot:36150-Rhodomonas_salina.8
MKVAALLPVEDASTPSAETMTSEAGTAGDLKNTKTAWPLPAARPAWYRVSAATASSIAACSSPPMNARYSDSSSPPTNCWYEKSSASHEASDTEPSTLLT